ncbi:MAG: hypothetical protein ACJA08_002492 [Cyclobacteriaceae bacterium]|jgi:hypothetical protein
MEPVIPFRIIFYILLIFIFSGMLYFLDDILMLHHTPEASLSNKPTKEYLSKKGEAPEKAEVIEENISARKPNFKSQIPIKPMIKESISDSDETNLLTKDLDKAVIEPIEFAKIEALVESSKPSDATYFQVLMKNYDQQVLSKLEQGDIRRDIIIRHYNHPADGDKVYVLRKLGFYIHERPVEGSLIGYESNAVFYGDDVAKEDLQLVVYYLINAGMPIKRIAKSQFHDGWKSSSIEIGTDTTVTKRSILTIDDLQRLTF